MEINCSICGKLYERVLYQIKRSKRHFCSNECKYEGQKISDEERRKNKKERYRQYKLKNKEKVTQYNKEYRQKNKGYFNKKSREWYLKNREKAKKRAKELYRINLKRNRERNNQRQKEWREKNPIKMLLRRQKYKKTENARIERRLRCAKEAAIKYGCKIGEKEKLKDFYRKVLNTDKIICYYCKEECGQDIPGYNKDITIDHKIPLCRKGNHDIKNMVMCCRECNGVKNGKTDKEFFEFLRIIRDNLD